MKNDHDKAAEILTELKIIALRIVDMNIDNPPSNEEPVQNQKLESEAERKWRLITEKKAAAKPRRGMYEVRKSRNEVLVEQIFKDRNLRPKKRLHETSGKENESEPAVKVKDVESWKWVQPEIEERYLRTLKMETPQTKEDDTKVNEAPVTANPTTIKGLSDRSWEPITESAELWDS